MTIIARSASVLAILLLTGGCSSANSTGISTPPPSAAVGAAVQRPSEATQAAFAAAFAQKWPQLAQNRSAKGLGNDLDTFCGGLSRGEALENVSKRLGARIATPAATPDPDTLAAIVVLARSFCR